MSTPFELRSTFESEDALEQERVDSGMVDLPYRSLVGSLMYLVVCTRSDLSMAVSSLIRYYQNPKIEHWKAAKRVLRYIKGSVGEGLAYNPS